MNKAVATIKKEIREMISPTIYFFVSLTLIAFVHRLMLKGTDIAPGTWIQVAVAALILGKAVLISDMMPLINRYPNEPLIYNIAWKTVIYFFMALGLHYLEHLLDYWKEAGGFVAANAKMRAQIIWPHFWAIQIILLVVIFDYCVLHELRRVIGPEKLAEMFFGRRAAARA